MNLYTPQLVRSYRAKKSEILSRLKEFKRLGSRASDAELFAELAFCILTPQSKAKACWSAVVNLRKDGSLLKANASRIESKLYGVRFKRKKAMYIARARKLFMAKGRRALMAHLRRFDDIRACREWLVENVCGLGYKEASHFLRNIGFALYHCGTRRAEELAILDRHILKNLMAAGVIREIPKAMTKKRYLRIEEAMANFARRVKIPLSYLDLLFWSNETGEIFK